MVLGLAFHTVKIISDSSEICFNFQWLVEYEACRMNQAATENRAHERLNIVEA
jgi:hypothetical protein